MTRHRRSAFATWAAALVVGVVGVAAWDTSYVALRPLDNPPLVWVSVWVLASIGVLLWAPSRRTVLIGAVPFLVAALLTAYGTFFATLFDASDEVLVRRLATRDHEVRIVRYIVLEPIVEVRVRTREGLLSREWAVWHDESYVAPDVTLTGPRSLDVRDADGVVHHVTF